MNTTTETVYFFNTMDETTVVHESGHIIDYRLGFASSEMARMVALDTAPTEYGRRNQLEDFAVSWSYWVSRPDILAGDKNGAIRYSFFTSLIVDYGAMR